MRQVFRRVSLGFGTLLFAAGVGVFFLGQQLLRALIAYAVEDKAQGDNAFKALAAGVFLASIGAAVIATALPATRAPKAA
jgi:hypothetical protein